MRNGKLVRWGAYFAGTGFFVLFCLMFCGFTADSAELPGPQLRERFGLPEGDLPVPETVFPISTRAAEPWLEDVSMAHMGGDRILAAFRFRKNIPDISIIVAHLYLDLDNDPGTGRDDEQHEGVDLRITLIDGGINYRSSNPDFPEANIEVVDGSEGRTLFIAFDVPLPDEEIITFRGYTNFRVGGDPIESSPRDRIIKLERNDATVEQFRPRARMVEEVDYITVSRETVPDSVKEKLKIPAEIEPEMILVQEGDRDAMISELSASHLGGDRILVRAKCKEPITEENVSDFVFYIVLDDDWETGVESGPHRGVDLVVGIEGKYIITVPGVYYRSRNHKLYRYRENFYGIMAVDGKDLYLALQAPILDKSNGKVPLTVYIRRETSPARVQLPRSEAELPDLGNLGAEYRHKERHDRFIGMHEKGYIVLESYEHKGLGFWDVYPPFPFEYGRETPSVPFSDDVQKMNEDGKGEKQRVPVNLLEEAGISRKNTRASFGFPLPEGYLYDTSRIRLLDGSGAQLPAEFTVTSFWPDDSLKWVLIDFTCSLEANEEKDVYVEFGAKITREETGSSLKVREEKDYVEIDTGPLAVKIGKRQFRLLNEVRLKDASGNGVLAAAVADTGMKLTNDLGEVFGTAMSPPESFELERRGDYKAVLRVEGKYSDTEGNEHMRYVIRLKFRAGSKRIEIVHTLVNDKLEAEFSDLKSLELPIILDSGEREGKVYVRDEKGNLRDYSGKRISLFQYDENNYIIETPEIASGKSSGVFSVETGQGVFSAVLREFWERWPKGIKYENGKLTLELLPVQPYSNYGADLPHYLKYCFLEGFYRLKWGMAFTERITLDFGSEGGAEELIGETEKPLIAVVPGSWYVETEAMGVLAAPFKEQFRGFDEYVEKSFEAHMARKEEQREYGFLNYGDWFGERGRNWGNNEYDIAHAFFMQFARTGNRDYFRFALAAARHQADVDTVHAYPDPFYVGANMLHSIGHTGVSYQHMKYKGWSREYVADAYASNGHTWVHGMVAAWHLAGDERAMEAALLTGEHIVWAFAPYIRPGGRRPLGRAIGRPLRAMEALYRSTGDSVYKEAAYQMFEAIKKDKEATGRCLYKDAGIPSRLLDHHMSVLDGLALMHLMTGDPEVKSLFLEGIEKRKATWDDEIGGFPGIFHWNADTREMSWPRPKIAYAAYLTGDAEYVNMAERVLSNAIRGSDARAKDLSIVMYMAPETLGFLQRWYFENLEDKGAQVLNSRGYNLEKELMRVPEMGEHLVRLPEQKVFAAKLVGAEGKLIARAEPHGPQVSEREKDGSIMLFDSKGRKMDEAVLDSYGEREYEFNVKGETGEQFKFVIEDDRRSAWNVSGENLKVGLRVDPGFITAATSRRKTRVYIFVPEATRQFSVWVKGVHDGGYGAAALNPEGEIVEYVFGSNTKGFSLEEPDSRRFSVEVEEGDGGDVWQLILWASNNMSLKLEGITPYIFASRDDCFEPDR